MVIDLYKLRCRERLERGLAVKGGEETSVGELRRKARN